MFKPASLLIVFCGLVAVAQQLVLGQVFFFRSDNGIDGLTPLGMFIASSLLSAVGGCASELKRHWLWRSAVQTGLSTSIFGASLAMLSYYWISGTPELCWAVIGVCGLLSLGGQTSIEFVLSLGRRLASRWVEEYEPPLSASETSKSSPETKTTKASKHPSPPDK